MKKGELKFRKAFKAAIYDMLLTKTDYQYGRISAFEEIAELLYPHIDIEALEDRYIKEINKEERR